MGTLHQLLTLLALLASFGLCHKVYKDQSCYNPAYPTWSVHHMQTWCKDHDPSSTDQCAAVTWPDSVSQPKLETLHRNFRDAIFNRKPQMGTRTDCIARSSALSVNTQANKAGLVEAVTCDVYSFNRHRERECVCFPVYDDFATQYGDQSTISVFYPPAEVVERALLEAATEGTPTACTNCPTTVRIVQREPRELGNFPYCAIPAPIAGAGLASRTVMTAVTQRHGRMTTITTTFPALPTTTPDCNNETEYKTRSPSACNLDLCMWNFIDTYTSSRSSWVTFPDVYGNPVRVGWNTTGFIVSTKHWGVFPPLTNPASVSAMDALSKELHPLETFMAESYSAERVSLGLAAPVTTANKKLKKAEEEAKPVCQNESDCWQWCRDGQTARAKQTSILIALAALITAIAVAGMLCRFCCGRDSRARQSLPWRRSDGRMSEKEGTMDVVELEADAGPVPEVTETSGGGRASSVGSVRRAAEEGRGRTRIKFSPEDVNARIMGRDGAADEVSTASGRQPNFGWNGEGDSIRGRIPSGQMG